MGRALTVARLAALTGGVGLGLLWILDGAAHEDVRLPILAGKAYVAECGSCHTAYAPGLLPVRSWRKMMAELDRHFGEDASLEDEERDGLLRQMTELAADSPRANLLMRRIAAGIPAGEAPQRISATPFFGFVHDEVPAHVWKRAKIGGRSNCIACHGRANEGVYDEREVRIPE